MPHTQYTCFSSQNIFLKQRHSKTAFLLLLNIFVPAVEKKKVKIWSALTQIVKVRRSLCGQTKPNRLSAISVAGVLDEPFSQLTPLSRVAVQALGLQSTVHRLEPCPSYVAWRAGMAVLRSAGLAE
jgi:hypothetical protein